jgi:hypothetical protein
VSPDAPTTHARTHEPAADDARTHEPAPTTHARTRPAPPRPAPPCDPTPRAAEEQRAIDEAARETAEKIKLTAEDEAVFRACCYSSPDWLMRALLRTAASGVVLPPLGATTVI